MGYARIGTINNRVVCQPNAPVPVAPAPASGLAAASGEASRQCMHHLSSMRARLTAQHPSSHNTKDAFSFRAVRAMFVASAPSKHSEANDLTECLSCWCRHSNVCGADFLFITHPRMAHCGNCGANRCARGCGRCARHADHQEAAAGEAQGGCCRTGPAEGAMSVSQLSLRGLH